MEQSQIFGPMLVLMMLTVLVWFYMYSKRIPFIRSLNIDPKELTPMYLATQAPPSVSTSSDNLKNLFEVPVLFYTLTLYLYVTGQVDSTYVTAAWVYVIFRAVHSAVHCTVNIVMLRFVLYAISSLVFFFMLGRAVAGYFF